MKLTVVVVIDQKQAADTKEVLPERNRLNLLIVANDLYPNGLDNGKACVA